MLFNFNLIGTVLHIAQHREVAHRGRESYEQAGAKTSNSPISGARKSSGEQLLAGSLY